MCNYGSYYRDRYRKRNKTTLLFKFNKRTNNCSCGTTAIEEVCDIVQNNLEKVFLNQDKFITMRYSPGYGDLPIEKNIDILNVLNAQKQIGLTITSNGIMIPRKSVVAIIGISNTRINKSKKEKSCENCKNYRNCTYRKGPNSLWK